MTETRRIILNTLATYGRSLMALALGLFSARWVLAALGKEDLGLYGVVGSIIFCITFLSGMLSGPVARFYAYAVGEARKMSEEEGRDHVSQWFNAAFSIYFIMPLVLVGIGYPVGMYAIHHWLVIPAARVASCEWVLRFSLVAAFVGMSSIPFTAMYQAYQLITELSFWGVASTLLTFSAALMLLHVEGDRLMVYSAMMSAIPVAVNAILVFRARRHFPVCRIQWRYFWNGAKLRRLLSYSFWEFFACLGDMVRSQGTAFLINRNFGPAMNASYTVANQVSGHTTSLSAALLGALQPAVATAVGAADMEHARALAFRCSKFGALLILIFCVPLIVEIDEVLRLWLVHPPEGAAVVCRCILVALVCHKLGWGQHLAVCATGRIRGMQSTLGFISMATLGIIWMFIQAGWGMLGVGLSFIISYSLLTIVRAYFGWRLLGMSIRFWMFRILLPVIALATSAFALGFLVTYLLPQSFLRVCLTSMVTISVTGLCAWFFCCDDAERAYIRGGVRKIQRKFTGAKA